MYTIKLNIFLPVWMTLIRSHRCMRKQKILCSCSLKFLNQSGWNLVLCHGLLVCSSSCYFFSHKVDIQGSELNLHDFTENNWIWLRLPINSTFWHQCRWLWPSLKVTGLQESWICVIILWKVAWRFRRSSNIHSGWYVMEMAAKKSSEYGKYGSFSHLLLFAIVLGCSIQLILACLFRAFWAARSDPSPYLSL